LATCGYDADDVAMVADDDGDDARCSTLHIGTDSWHRRIPVYCSSGLMVIIGPIANLKGHYFQPSLSVCLSLTGTSTLQR